MQQGNFIRMMMQRYWLLFIFTPLLFSSCLHSNDDNRYEALSDARIYALALSSREDSLNLLGSTSFSIDQVNDQIFNKQRLPYGFNVHKAKLNIFGATPYGPFTNIELTLSDSTYNWNLSDSVSISKLRLIKTTAQDGIHQKTYHFHFNVYQLDPMIIKWEKITSEAISAAQAVELKTIALKDRFFTYYKNGTTVRGISSAFNDGLRWQEETLKGLPLTVSLQDLIESDNCLYAHDLKSSNFYRSEDGINWSQMSVAFPVKAIYGEMPTDDDKKILLAVKSEDSLYFAVTGDFTEFTLLNIIPDGIPIAGFSSTKVDSKTSYSGRYIIVSGGRDAQNKPYEGILIMRRYENEISMLQAMTKQEMRFEGSTLFFYDDKPYVMVLSEDKNNNFYFSENRGLDWIQAKAGQSLPDKFISRKYASVIIDADNYIWIFGGVTTDKDEACFDVWRGKLNKFV